MTPLHFKTHIGKLDYLMGTHYVEIPAEVVHALGGKFNVRLLCTVNNTVRYQGGIVALGQGRGYITLTKQRLKQLGVKEGSEVSVTLEKDPSQYGTPVPEELSELFIQDDEGKTRFDQLKPGMQRYIIQHVAAVKSSQLRIDRSIKLIGNLKQLKPGKETFREILGLEKREI
ncbi:YdeI/OmpD-associated family protein [Rufibacter psychrotolerans]|uniref:YdeI/OmpD-associated family protein n=1 Tax=Rufibacter psychrotolerans TaxID=2812556 RepID=UPI00196857AA|nr:YdeI/OmpD-associated family protein [Rufibacter sp. SYSU D00308]